MKAAISVSKRFPVLTAAVLLVLLLPTGALSAQSSVKGAAQLDPYEEVSGQIVSAKLTKKTFKSAQAKKVKLVVRFSPESAMFKYLLQIKKGGKWLKVKSVTRMGSFVGTRRMTVKSLFAGKPVKKGAYRLRLWADENSKTLGFRVI